MIVALVSFYLTNKLIMRRPFPNRRSFNPKITCGIRHHFWCLSLSLGYVPTCYSAVRRSCTPAHYSIRFGSLPLSVTIKQSAGALPLDLHVLGTPPAFILSQDQTLHRDSRPTRYPERSLTGQESESRQVLTRTIGNHRHVHLRGGFRACVYCVLLN